MRLFEARRYDPDSGDYAYITLLGIRFTWVGNGVTISCGQLWVWIGWHKRRINFYKTTDDYVCKCGRRQSNIGDATAEIVGWRKIRGKWNCPFCTGNMNNLLKVFSGD